MLVVHFINFSKSEESWEKTTLLEVLQKSKILDTNLQSFLEYSDGVI